MPAKEQKIGLVFIINGQDYVVEANVNEPLSAAVQRALNESGNQGRPAADWEVRNAAGVLLEQSRKIEDLRLENGARLFLSLRVGAGGVGKS